MRTSFEVWALLRSDGMIHLYIFICRVVNYLYDAGFLGLFLRIFYFKDFVSEWFSIYLPAIQPHGQHILNYPFLKGDGLLSKKLEKLQEQMAKLQEQIQAEETRLKEEDKKRRKKMVKIIGEFYLHQAESNGGIAALAATLDQAGCLKKPADRALFDLPAERPSAKPNKSTIDAQQQPTT